MSKRLCSIILLIGLFCLVTSASADRERLNNSSTLTVSGVGVFGTVEVGAPNLTTGYVGAFDGTVSLRTNSYASNGYMSFGDSGTEYGRIGRESSSPNLRLRGVAAGSDIEFYPGNTLSWSMADTTGSGALVGQQTNNTIRSSTADASDNARTRVCGGGDCSSGRGGYGNFNGNEFPSEGGFAQIVAGNVSGAKLQLINLEPSGPVEVKPGGNTLTATFDSNGNLVMDATNGGNVVFGAASTKGILIPHGSAAAAGSTISDATQLTAVETLVSGADGTKGVKLPDIAVGLKAWVYNNAGAVLLVYPEASGSTIAGKSAGAAASVGNVATLVCKRTGGASWHCTEGANP